MLSVRKRSMKQEQNIAKDLGGRAVAGSGSTPWQKGDVRTDSLLVEAKFSDAEFYTLTKATWAKIEREAAKDGLRIPVMIIEIKEKKLVVADFNIFRDYLQTQEPEFTLGYGINFPNPSFRIQRTANWNNYYAKFKLSGVMTETLCCIDYYRVEDILNELR